MGVRVPAGGGRHYDEGSIPFRNLPDTGLKSSRPSNNLRAHHAKVVADIVKVMADNTEVKDDNAKVKADIVNVRADIAKVQADIVNVGADIVKVNAPPFWAQTPHFQSLPAAIPYAAQAGVGVSFSRSGKHTPSPQLPDRLKALLQPVESSHFTPRPTLNVNVS